jgi:hypothetical protein
MYAAASSLIEAIKASYNGVGVPTGTDWDYIPSGDWYKYGSGGISSWGTLCGVPNGCIAVLNLMNLHSTFAEQILYHYCQTEFPLRGLHDLYLSDPDPSSWSREPMPDEDVLAYTTANSPLCHASVSKWAYAAGVDMGAPGTTTGTAHKTDRCAKVVAEVTSFVAGLLNGVTSGLVMADDTAACYTCHQTHPSIGPAQQGKMDCGECHTDNRPHIASNLSVTDVWTLDGSGNPKSTFTAGDPIQYKVEFTVGAGGSSSYFVKTNKSKVKGLCGKIQPLAKSQALSGGTHDWTWSGTVPSGCTGNAKVIINLQMFDYQGGTIVAQASKIRNFTIA